MTTITPPIAPQPLPSSPSVAPVVVVQSPPAALARLAIGQLLEVTVTIQTAKNVFQVQTPLGQLQIQTALPLPKGGVLVLQLQSQSPAVQFQINSLNGSIPPNVLKPGNAAALASGIAARAVGKVPGHDQPATIAKLIPGNVLQATVLRPMSQPPGQSTGVASAPANPATSALKGAPPGQLGTTQGLAKQAGPQAPVSAKRSGPTPAPAHNHSSVGKAASPLAAKPSGVLPSGSQLSVRITGVQLPNPATTGTTPAAPTGPTTNPTITPGTPLSGTVTGSTPAGHTIVQTRVGTFALATQTVVPRGSVISLEVVTAPSPLAVKPGDTTSLHQSMFASRKWPALEQVIQVLHEATPTTAQQLVNSFIPRPDAGLTSGLLFFLTALRGGDMRSLIGEAPMRLIESRRPNLAGRVSEDFTALARIADEPGPSDWRVALIPINTGAEIEQIRLLMRQHGSDDEEATDTGDSRFVIDVELSTFGRLQLDGLVRNNGKSLDLIIRSEVPLSETMHDDIRTIFLDAADLTGLTGSVNFQAAPPLFIDIADPSIDHDLGLVV